MLSVDRDADAAVESRIRIEWNKFKQLRLKHVQSDEAGCCDKNKIK